MAFSLFGKPKRRRRSRGGGGLRFGSGGGDAALAIVALGGVGIVGYFVLMGSGTIKQFLKNATDSLNSSGDWLGDGSCWIQKQLGVGACGEGHGLSKKFHDLGETSAKFDRDFYGGIDNIEKGRKSFVEDVERGRSELVGNAACHLQRGFGILTGGFFGKSPECSGWFTKKDSRVIALHYLTASPKPYPKMTNNVYHSLVRMGADPDFI